MARYGHMLKAEVRGVRVRIRMTFVSEGSVMAGTITSRCTGVESRLEVDSDEDPALIGALIQNARAGCFAEAAIAQPVEIRAVDTLNGAPFEAGAHPKRPPRRTP